MSKAWLQYGHVAASAVPSGTGALQSGQRRTSRDALSCWLSIDRALERRRIVQHTLLSAPAWHPRVARVRFARKRAMTTQQPRIDVDARWNALLERTLRAIVPANRDIAELATKRQRLLTKPAGSLGRLEELAERAAAARGTLVPRADDRAIFVFAADHGVAAEGVSAYPPEVTAQMVANFVAGGGAINAISRSIGAELWVVDVGVNADLSPAPRLVQRKVARGSANFMRERAMSSAQTIEAISVGIESVAEAAARGVEIVAVGEMGIGSTTSASAVAAVLCERTVASVVGRGTGVDDASLAHKIEVVERALALHHPDRSAPLDVLASVGGLEIAAICGACLGAAANRILLVVDGLIATAGAALAARLSPAAADYMIAGHRSVEPGHTSLLELIGLRPVLDLEMRLGEATGAALAIPVVAAALAAFREMATFESAGVSDRE